MSATGRGAVRTAHDFYATPAWCVKRLLERVALPGKEWFEPAAGDGAIIRAVNSMRIGTRWTACDIRPECKEALIGLVDGPDTFVGVDFTNGDFGGTDFDVVITNPPYSLALEFVDYALDIAPVVVMLMRLNWLEGSERAEFLRRKTPDVYVLPNRPSFTGHGTDATAYCWMVWRPGDAPARLEILDSTSIAERKSK